MGFTSRFWCLILVICFGVSATSCSREAVLGSDQPVASVTAVPTATTTKSARPIPRTAPAATGNVGAPWAPDVSDWTTTTATVAALLRDPGCANSREMATRLEAVWRLWYGKTVRRAQPDYPDLVLEPITQITSRCGPEYAKEVYQELGYQAPGILDRITESAGQYTEQPAADPSTTPTS